MKNLRKLTRDSAESSKVAYLFVFVTVLIGSSAILPTAIFQENSAVQGLDATTSDAFTMNVNKQTGRYLKMPRWF